ncbi:MAG: 16S rRNA (uracil(1498)-N(3))-methyltransferase [Bacilli bacterium]|nr:16S rRNA (uracil(1498)-N(3))-methyltransferase [Bacilli bacterium]
MQHYFGEISEGLASLSESDRHHLLHVKRAEKGERVEISTCDGRLFSCIIKNLDPLEIEVDCEVEDSREGRLKVFLGFSLLKADHNELIIQKCTELGVAAFFPFLSERTVVKPDGKEDKRLLRLRKIAEESAKQCRRNIIPEVHGYSSFKEVLGIEADVRYLPYEGLLGSSDTLWNEIHLLDKEGSVLFLIGPEGGFSDKEVALAKEKGFRFVSLGRRMLRAETAAIYCASLMAGRSD